MSSNDNEVWLAIEAISNRVSELTALVGIILDAPVLTKVTNVEEVYAADESKEEAKELES
jgi:hypothetical protein